MGSGSSVSSTGVAQEPKLHVARAIDKQIEEEPVFHPKAGGLASNKCVPVAGLHSFLFVEFNVSAFGVVVGQ